MLWRGCAGEARGAVLVASPPHLQRHRATVRDPHNDGRLSWWGTAKERVPRGRMAAGGPLWRADSCRRRGQVQVRFRLRVRADSLTGKSIPSGQPRAASAWAQAWHLRQHPCLGEEGPGLVRRGRRAQGPPSWRRGVRGAPCRGSRPLARAARPATCSRQRALVAGLPLVAGTRR